MSNLETLVPSSFELTINDDVIKIQPLRIGQLPAFLRAISPVIQQLTAPSINWLDLFSEHGDNLLSAIAIALKKPRHWVDELSADEAILVSAKVIEVNADFFARTVIPRVNDLFQAAKMAAVTSTTGSTPSNT